MQAAQFLGQNVQEDTLPLGCASALAARAADEGGDVGGGKGEGESGWRRTDKSGATWPSPFALAPSRALQTLIRQHQKVKDSALEPETVREGMVVQIPITSGKYVGNWVDAVITQCHSKYGEKPEWSKAKHLVNIPSLRKASAEAFETQVHWHRL